MTPRPHYATLYRDCQAALVDCRNREERQLLDFGAATKEYLVERDANRSRAEGRIIALQQRCDRFAFALIGVGLLALGLAIALVVTLARFS